MLELHASPLSRLFKIPLLLKYWSYTIHQRRVYSSSFHFYTKPSLINTSLDNCFSTESPHYNHEALYRHVASPRHCPCLPFRVRVICTFLQSPRRVLRKLLVERRLLRNRSTETHGLCTWASVPCRDLLVSLRRHCVLRGTRPHKYDIKLCIPWLFLESQT